MDTTTPMDQRPNHLHACCEQHDCKGQTCEGGQILASNIYATQPDPAQLWVVQYPMSDQDIIDMNAAVAAAEAKAAADAAAATAAAEAEAVAKANAEAKIAALGLTIEDIRAALA